MCVGQVVTKSGRWVSSGYSGFLSHFRPQNCKHRCQQAWVNKLYVLVLFRNHSPSQTGGFPPTLKTTIGANEHDQYKFYVLVSKWWKNKWSLIRLNKVPVLCDLSHKDVLLYVNKLMLQHFGDNLNIRFKIETLSVCGDNLNIRFKIETLSVFMVY